MPDILETPAPPVIEIVESPPIEIDLSDDIEVEDLPGIPAEKITSGTLNDARIPSGIARDAEVLARIAEGINDHVDTANPHDQYALESDVAQIQGVLSAALTAHEAAVNPHPTYATDADLSAAVASIDAAIALLNVALAGKQAGSSNLTDLAGQASTAFGRSLLALTNGLSARLLLTGNEEFRQSTKPTTRADGSALQAGDRWLNTSDHTWWYWDSSLAVWLSQQIFVASGTAGTSTSASGSYGILPIDPAGDDLYITSFSVAGSIATTNDATNYWSFQPFHRTVGSSTAIGSALNSLSFAIGEDFFISTQPNVLLDVSAIGIRSIRATLTRTGTPGNFTTGGFRLEFRRAKL